MNSQLLISTHQPAYKSSINNWPAEAPEKQLPKIKSIYRHWTAKITNPSSAGQQNPSSHWQLQQESTSPHRTNKRPNNNTTTHINQTRKWGEFTESENTEKGRFCMDVVRGVLYGCCAVFTGMFKAASRGSGEVSKKDLKLSWTWCLSTFISIERYFNI